MNVALLFFLLLIPLSGFIAWAGDRIGHKVGKKRRSLFGLRPRHTATLITVAAGFCIALVTFGLMWVSNASFRLVMARGVELLDLNEKLKAENAAVLAEVAAKRQDIGVLNQQVASLQTQASQEAAGERAARQEYQAAQTNYVAAQSTLTDLQGRLNVKASDLAAAQARVTSAQHRLQGAQSAVNAADGRRVHAEHMEQEAETAERAAQVALADAQHSFQEATDEQSRHLSGQRSLIDKQDAQITDQQTQIADQQKQLTDLNTELDGRRKELDSLRQVVTDFRTATTRLRDGQITYRVNQEVDRVSIPGGISVWRIEFVLDSLLNSAGKKAETRGAARVAQTERAVALMPPLALPAELQTGPQVASAGDGSGSVEPDPYAANGGLLPPHPDGGVLPGVRGPNSQPEDAGLPHPTMPAITESDLIRTAAEAIRRENRDVVVIAVASANAVAGEPVPVDIHTYRNPVVLTAGEKVGEVTVDGTASRQEIVDALYGFLHNEVRSRLLQAGVIPPLDASEPGPIVTLSGDAWLKILDDVRKAGSRAQITVKIDKTTRAADPVSLHFDVKRAWNSEDLPTAAHPSPSASDDPATSGVTDGASARSDSGAALW